MRHIRTNHNPLTVSDILLENGTARLEDFYPLTKVKTASDKEKLLSQGYNPGYTVSELNILRWRSHPISWNRAMESVIESQSSDGGSHDPCRGSQ